jgi:hypothetical protein
MGELASMLKRRAPFFLTMLCLALVVGFIVYDVRARATPALPPAPTVTSEENGDYAQAGWKVRMLSGLEVTLAGVEKSGVTWFFHFSIANPTSKTVIARGPDTPTPADSSADQTALDHQFVVYVYPRSLTPEYRPLSATSANDRARQALPGSLALRPGQRADGWLQVDVTQSVGLAPNALFSIHDPRASMKFDTPPAKAGRFSVLRRSLRHGSPKALTEPLYILGRVVVSV